MAPGVQPPPGLPPTLDPQKNQTSPELPGPESIWTVGDDGHTHRTVSQELEEILRGHGKEKKPGKGKDDLEIAQEVIHLFRVARDYEDESRKMAVESEKFYRGEQWEKDDKKALEDSKRAALTLNEIEPKIDLLSGYQRQNRSDIKFLPVEEGDQRVVDVLNIITKSILDQNNFEYEETQVFDDTLITGRGMFHAYIDYDKNVSGDIVLEQFPQADVYLGPHKRPDARDCEYIVKAQWFSEAKLKQMYPDKADEIQRNLEAMLMPVGDSVLQAKPDAYDRAFAEGETKPAPLYPSTPDLIDIAKKEFLLLECWRKQYDKVPVAVVDGEPVSLEDWGPDEVKGAKQLVKVVDRKIDRLRVTVGAGSVLLTDDYNEDYGDTFPIIPVYAKKRADLYWGKVEGGKDAQREINKRHSQLVDILNKAASYGWFYDAGTFPDRISEQQFTKNAGTPGFRLKVSDVTRPPHQVEGIRFPHEIASLEEISTQKLREIMNINPELLGINSKAESGIAQMEKKRQGLIGNEFLFDNMNLAKKQIGRLLVRLIQAVYSPERILRVISGANSRAPVSIGQQPYDDNRQAEIVTLLTTSDLTKYDVAVSEAAHSPTQRRANFAAWAELARGGIAVPPELLVQLSDLDEKDKVIAQMQAMAQAQQQLEERKLQVELQKTIIAKDPAPQAPSRGMPPGVIQ